MKLLVKLGGTLLDAPETRKAVAEQIQAAWLEHAALTVVHGGGKQMTRFLSERGVESRFVRGLRVTTPEIIDAVLKVFAGAVNKELVAALIAKGAPAVGLCGVDGLLAEAEVLDAELGQVGKIIGTNGKLLSTLIDGGFLPVVACVAAGRDGTIYNVNADQMAVACAAAGRVDRLIFLTDVDGVRGAGGNILPDLTIAGARGLIEAGVATGGMQAKLNSAAAAIEAGITEVVIAPGAEKGVLSRLLSGIQLGTRIHQ